MSRGISFVIFGVLKLALVHYGFSVTYFALAQAFEFLLSGILLTFFLSRAMPLSSIRINGLLMKKLIRDAAPILFSEIAILVYMRTDQVMIGEMIGDRALGNYSAAVKLSEIWYFIPGIICSSLFPSIVKAHSHSIQVYHHKLQQLYDLLSGISVGIAAVVSVSSFLIIGILFGPDYSAASTVLTIHVWTGVFVFWGLASNQQLVIEGLTRLSLYRTIIGMIVNIVFNFLLIPLWGINGAAVATLLAQASSAWLSNLFFKQSRSIFWMNFRSLNPVRFIALMQVIIKKGF
jgi:PST family polysaccharide transporter